MELWPVGYGFNGTGGSGALGHYHTQGADRVCGSAALLSGMEWVGRGLEGCGAGVDAVQQIVSSGAGVYL